MKLWINPLIRIHNERVYPLEKTDKTLLQLSVLSIIQFITLSIILTTSANAFSLIINEPVNSASTPIQPYFHPSSLNPFGDIRDIFVGQTISGQLHNSSQFYNNTQNNFGPYSEICDASGSLLQVFNSIQYSIIANQFPQAPASAGIVSINSSDLPSFGINPPQGHHFSCFTPTLSSAGAFMTSIPNGFTQNTNLNLGVGLSLGPNNSSIIQSCIYQQQGAPINIMQVFDVPSYNSIVSITCPQAGWCCLNQSTGIQISQNQLVQVSLCNTNNFCDIKMIIG